MMLFSTVYTILLLALSSIVYGGSTSGKDLNRRVASACVTIEKKISSASKVFYLASANYVADNHHYLLSSSQPAACIVEVGSTKDTAEVITIIGSTRSPFGIKAGGHASNPGFSSTPGVLISLVRLKTFKFSADKSSIVLGTGNIWATDVYPKLDDTSYNVVGGRVTGPGVGGVTLGGGFSWLTNQYGLAVDTVQSFTTVLPNGTIAKIDSSQPDLFFALKGGLNRFGVVTEIKYKTFPKGPNVWGGYKVYAESVIPKVLAATAEFSNSNTDPKAQVITTLSYLNGLPAPVVLFFYDGPSPSASLGPLNNIPALTSDISTRSFSSLVQAPPGELSGNVVRGAFHTLSTTGYTKTFLDAVNNETKYYGKLATLNAGIYISYDIEPFLPTYGQKATDSAYPHSESPLPLNLFYTWSLPAKDEFWRTQMQKSVDTLLNVARQEGILNDKSTAYPNYALSTYGGDKLYGSANAARLRAIKQSVDPTGVFDLAGGFKI